ncbi:DUF7282 domain-containing protein [Halorussus halobius]|uniref:DUF7282 domain-containing protein n=1 Tax=Halorussus halobius TaxID=1710537 RepID=UPI0010931924|nr:hypothetical protein [Halorussus halobius]
MTRKATLVAIVAMLAVGTSAALVVGAGATGDAAMAQETTMEETTTAMTQETTAAESASVTVEDQSSNGSTVTVDEVMVPEGGFVVIHAAEGTATETMMEDETTMETEMATETEMDTAMETDAGEGMAQEYTAGEVLGNSTYLEAGTHENVTVELDAPLDESQVVIAMAHLDTNDNQMYEFPEADDPYTEDGAAVVDWANVTVEDAGETTAADEEDAETTTEEA